VLETKATKLLGGSLSLLAACGRISGQKAIRAFSTASIHFQLEKIMQTLLRKSLVITALALGAAQLAHAQQSDVARWQSVIGIIQGGNVVGSGTGAVTGAPGPWSARGGQVTVDLTHGKIAFNTHGLVFAAGNAIGNTGTVAQVKGTLVCDTDGSASAGNSILVDTPLVELDEEGDAHFSGNVSMPVVCATEPDIAFLIRTASGRWIGNGTVLR
jgi:hypothetical protein